MKIVKKAPEKPTSDICRTTQELEALRVKQEKTLIQQAKKIQELVPYSTPLPLEAPAK